MGYRRERRRRAGKGDRPGSRGENLPSPLFASLQAKIQSRGQGTGGWYELLGSLVVPEWLTPLTCAQYPRDLLRAR